MEYLTNVMANTKHQGFVISALPWLISPPPTQQQQRGNFVVLTPFQMQSRALLDEPKRGIAP